jgi:phosphohistidine phosphatase SixA/8-oxo-dGTP pyrophosphatase MutT (NUDIX family)
MAGEPVRAAGVVLTRGTGSGAQTLVLYRPLRRDWSLPKGKLDPGEHVLDCAVRECDEETGIVPLLGVPLGKQRYEAMGRPKTVDYWQARVGADNGFVPDDEVSEVRWVGIDEARALLTYRRDVEYVERAMALPPTAPLIVLRHGAAVSRSDYDGDDRSRPLTGKGRSQARSLASLLAAFGIEVVCSSDSARCVETVRPFAAGQKITIEQEPIFSEGGYERAPEAALARLETLLADGRPIVLCTHRPVLPGLLNALTARANGPTKSLLKSVQSRGLTPGGFVVAHRTTGEDPRVVAAEHAKPKKADHDARHSLPV